MPDCILYVLDLLFAYRLFCNERLGGAEARAMRIAVSEPQVAALCYDS